MYYRTYRRNIQGLLASNPNFERSWTLYALGRIFTLYKRVGGPGTMGRFGGGWEVKFGFQSGSWTDLLLLRSVIFALFIVSFRISMQDDRRNEARAREEDRKIREDTANRDTIGGDQEVPF